MIAPDQRIESQHNPRFRQLMQLVESSRERRRSARTVLEGVHLVQAFWLAWYARMDDRCLPPAPRLHALYVPLTDVHPEVTALLGRIRGEAAGLEPAWRPRVIGLKEALFRQASQVRSGIGPLAIIDTPRPALPAHLSGDALYLDRVQDPANVGAIIRTAAAAGIGQVLLSPHAAFCWAPKVLRAAMGAHFAVGLHEDVAWTALTDERLGGLTIRALVAPSQQRPALTSDLHALDLRAPTLWVCGQEGQGVEAALLADPRVARVHIAQAPGVESLNVAAAAAVALFEQRRQRGAAVTPASA